LIRLGLGRKFVSRIEFGVSHRAWMNVCARSRDSAEYVVSVSCVTGPGGQKPVSQVQQIHHGQCGIRVIRLAAAARMALALRMWKSHRHRPVVSGG